MTLEGSPVLPFELLGAVVESIIADDDVPTLKACSLSSRHLTLNIQRALYARHGTITFSFQSRINFWTKRAQTSRSDLAGILKVNPLFGRNLTDLNIAYDRLESVDDPDFAFILSCCTAVARLKFEEKNQYGSEGYFQEPIRTSIERIVSSGTLKSLTFCGGSEMWPILLTQARTLDSLYLVGLCNLDNPASIKGGGKRQQRFATGIRHLNASPGSAWLLATAAHEDETQGFMVDLQQLHTFTTGLDPLAEFRGVCDQLDMTKLLRRPDVTNLTKVEFTETRYEVFESRNIFAKPHPACFGYSLEHLVFRAPSYDMHDCISDIRRLAGALACYPSPNNIQTITLSQDLFSEIYLAELGNDPQVIRLKSDTVRSAHQKEGWIGFLTDVLTEQKFPRLRDVSLCLIIPKGDPHALGNLMSSSQPELASKWDCARSWIQRDLKELRRSILEELDNREVYYNFDMQVIQRSARHSYF